MNYDALLVAKDHSSYSLARYNRLQIRRQVMEFCDEVDLNYDTELSLAMLGCSVSVIDESLKNNGVFGEYSLVQLILAGWDLGLSVADICMRLSRGGNTLDDIYDIETELLQLVPDCDVYKIPFNYTINKGKQSDGKSRVDKYCFRTSNVRETMQDVFGSVNTVNCITLDGFIKWFLGTYKTNYTSSNIVTFYDTLRYSGCPKDLADAQLEYILAHDFKFEDVPMFYIDTLRTCTDTFVLGRDYGFISLNDIIYLCDLNYKDKRQAYRVFFKEGYVCKRYIKSLNDGERPIKFSSYLRTAVTFNKEFVFDKDGHLIKDISDYTLKKEIRKECLTSKFRDIGFTTCFLFDN